MSQYVFHRPIKLAGETFYPGNRELTEKAENDPYFLKAVEMGWISDFDESKEVKAESVLERSQRLLAKFQKKSVKTEAPVESEMKTEAPIEAEAPGVKKPKKR